MDIPFTRPSLGEAEVDAVARAVRDGHVGGNGPICKRVEETLRTLTRSKHVLLTPNATSALEIALMALDVGPGDEVILPSFAFVSQATAIVGRGARPVFCEIDPRTMNIDVSDVEKRITENTRAIMPVHYAGIACDLEALKKLRREHEVAIVEDAAHGLGGYWRGQHLGTIGDAGCISFHETKNVVCGEGGALLLSRDDLMERAERIHEKGTDRSAFMRGQVEKYTWVDVGGSYALSDLLAALLEAQLQRSDEMTRARNRIWTCYHEHLAGAEEAGLLLRPIVPDGVRHNAHIYALQARTPGLRDELLDGLKRAGIQATFHFQPLHDSPYAKRVLGINQRLPQTETVAASIVRLPLWADMSEDQTMRVVDETLRICERMSAR